MGRRSCARWKELEKKLVTAFVTMEGLRWDQLWADAGFGNRRADLVARRGVVCFHCLCSISIICLLSLSAFNFYHFSFLDRFAFFYCFHGVLEKVGGRYT